jgi:hypothetical protein
MRILSQSWSNFSKGYQTARDLEQQARSNWQASWHKSVSFAQEQGVKKAANFIQIQISNEKRTLRLILILLAGVVLLMAVLSSLVKYFPNLGWILLPASVLNVLQALALLLPIVEKLRTIAALSRVEPRAETPRLPLDVTEQWWKSVVDAEPEPDGSARFDFLAYLSSSLPNDYFAVRSLLVKKSLDVDVLVIGPTGIWIFEVKDWRGRVTCRNGVWRHEGPGNLSESPERAFDEQWLDGRNTIEQTLSLKLARNARLGTLLRGGLVFTHPGLELDIDGSSRAEYGTPAQWLQRMRNAEKIQQFSIEIQLLILDALLDYAFSLYVTRPLVNSAVDLARALYGDVLENLRQYILRQVRSRISGRQIF